MATTGAVQDMIDERKRQRINALKVLTGYRKNKITLLRPVFFVPGWTDESCANWGAPYRSAPPIKEWFKLVTTNYLSANFITFTEQESTSCNSFLDFGFLVKNKIQATIGSQKSFDIVGHSMGGLDIRAAIAVHNLSGVENCITVASPHKGTQLGDIAPKFMQYKPHHKIQCINLDPDHVPVQTINTLQNRKIFLSAVKRLYQFVGTQDMAVARNAKIDVGGIDSTMRDKIITVEVGGATHSAQGGITRDIRVVLALLNILIGTQPDKPKYNYGYVLKKA